MGSSYSRRREELFGAALQLPAEKRGAFLERECGDDSALFRDLSELLKAHEEPEGLLEDLSNRIVRSAPSELETAARPRVQIGPWALDSTIGHGGMGVVYKASRADGDFDQRAALKLLHLDMTAPKIQARFLAERQLLAGFEHPNIARLLDGGVTDEGRPYFVMDYIDGQPLTDYCRARSLSLEESLRLFLKVVDAVSYLHRNLVVHRDLKPSNIYVRHDGVVKLLDFGIAKLMGEEGESVSRTVTGEQLLTPQYAAPEQIFNRAITTATDVYGLGAVLYELVSGRRIRDQKTLDLGSIRTETTASPSEALRRHLSEEASPGEALTWRRLPKDLDDICLMALRPEPERRYASAELLGQDVERLLDGLPVSASPDTLGYRLSKFSRRNRKGVIAGAAVLALLVFGFLRERSLRDQAQIESSRAQAVSDFLGRLITSADPANARGRKVTVEEVLANAETTLSENEQLASQPEVEAAIRVVLGKTFQNLGEVSAATVHLERALELAGGLEGTDPAAVEAAVTLAKLGIPVERREELIRWALDVRRDALGADHPDTLSAMSTLSRLLRTREDSRAEAETLDRKVLEKRRAVLGAEHPDTLQAMNSLAGVLFGAARYSEAAELYRNALEIARRTLGSDHPETLRFTSNLGATYSAMGRYLESEPFQRVVVAERRKVLGDLHHRTGTSMHNFGILMMHLGRYSEAEIWLRRAVEARSEEHGAGYLFSKSYLGDALRELGRVSEAESLYREALDEQVEQLGAGHPDALRTTASLAGLRFQAGDLAGAERLASPALAKQLEVEGRKALEATDTLHVLAGVRLEQGRLEEAVILAERALAIAEGLLDAGHPIVLRCRLEQGRALLAAGMMDQAHEALDDLDVSLADSLGTDHPRAREARKLVARAAEATS